MNNQNFRKTPEGFALMSAIVGVLLAALLAQTHVLAFGSFAMMAIVFLVADLVTYVTMKIGLIKSPGSWGRQKP